MKALNRLKAKLLTILRNQGISRLSGINRSAIFDIWNQETRRYALYPNKLVQDVNTGFQLPDLNAVLNGNIEPVINAHISMRRAHDAI
jgi:protein subunit release factor A